MKPINSRFALFTSLLISLNVFVQNASALDFTWTNGDANLTWDDSSGNWTTGTGNIPWVDGNAAIFGATGAGAITVSGTRTITGLTTNAAGYTLSTGGTIALGGAATPFVINNNVTINSAITGSGLTKTGAGTFTLAGANSHTGATAVNAGILALSSVTSTLASSAVTANSTGIFSVANTNATGSAVTRANGLTLNGGKLTVAGVAGQNTTDSFGILTLGQGAGVPSGSTQSASVLGGGNNVIFISPNAAKNTRLNFTSVSANAGGTVLFSTPTGSGAIGATSLASATAGGISVAFTGTAPALIGDAVSGGMITTTSGVIPWAIANAPGGTNLADFVTYEADYGVRTLAGTYGTTLALAVSVPQNVKLTAPDTTNNTNATVNSLILNNAASSLSQSIIGTLTVNSGALLLNPGFFNSVALSTTISGGTLQLGTGGADGFISMQQGRLNTISSPISGPDASHKLVLNFGSANNSTGVLVLGANNSYTGGTIVNSSTASSSLVIGGTSTLGLTMTAGTSGSFGSGDVALNNIKVLLNRSDAVTIANNFSGGAGSILQSAASTATLSGNISGSVGFGPNNASGTMILSGTNTNTGVTTLSAGTLQFNGSASMSGGSALALTTGTTLNLRSDTTASFSTAGITAPGIGTYNIDIANLTSGAGQALTLAGAMDFATGNQSLNVTGSSSYTLGLGAITHNTTANGSSFTINAATAPTTISSFKFGSYGSNLTLQSGNVSIGGLIFNSNGSETITVAGANATFTGSNTSTNNRAAGTYAVVLNSGTLNMNYAGFMTNINSGGSSLTLAGGTLDNNSGSAVTESWNPAVALNGDFAFGGTNDLNLGTGAVTLNASHTITTNGSALLTLGGGFGGAGFTIAKAGTGNLRLNGVINTGSGGVTVNGGKLTLAGGSSYTGDTTISAGTLAITGGGFITSSVDVHSGAVLDVSAKTGAFSVGIGKTLTGAGTVVGPVSIAGTIAPGTGAATLTTGAVTLTGTLAIEVNGATGDKLLSTGAVTLTGAGLTVSELAGGFSQSSYVIAQGASLSGTFATVPSGYQVSYSSTQAILTKTVTSGYGAWAAANAGGGLFEEDYDNDGTKNGVEYFMGQTGSSFTANPQLAGNLISYPRNATATGVSFKVLTSQNLTTWADKTNDADISNPAFVKYSLPSGQGKIFVRLEVTEN